MKKPSGPFLAIFSAVFVASDRHFVVCQKTESQKTPGMVQGNMSQKTASEHFYMFTNI